jgi:transcriptional regulator with XRE-family HTH domain
MPVVATAKPDGAKIRALIKERGYTVTEFARKIGRARQSIWNIAGYELPVSITFLRQIARELGVKVSEISDWTGDGDMESDAEMKVPA